MSEKRLKATHEGTLKIGSVEIACAVLENGQRVLTQSSFMTALGRARQAKGRAHYDSDVNLPSFLTAKNLKSFIPEGLEVTSSQIVFKPLKGNVAYGYPAELLPKVCDVFLDAKEAKAIIPSQEHIYERAHLLMRGLAHVGVIALVDEATGYQEVRDRQALQAILDLYLRDDLARWAKTFPDEFYKEIFRLRGWQWKGMKINRPSIVGTYTKDIVYERIAPGLLKELESRNPKDEKGQRRHRYPQWFNEELGHPALKEHLHATIALMRASASWESFYRLLQRAFPKKEENLPLLLDD